MRTMSFMPIALPKGGEGQFSGSDQAGKNQLSGDAFNALFEKMAAAPVPPADDSEKVAVTPVPNEGVTVEVEALLAEFVSAKPEPAGEAGAKEVSSEVDGKEATGEENIPLIGAAIAAVTPKMTPPGKPSVISDQAGAGGGEEPLPAIEGGELDGKAAGPVVVKVRAQETHFKPVVEGFTSKVASPVAAGQTGLSHEAEFTGESGEPSSAEPPLRAALAKPEAGERRPVELSASPVIGSDEQNAGGFSPQMLQRISSSIAGEARHLAPAARPHFMETISPSFVATARASDAAVRHLTIDLHPVELGQMTVSMKLSGDVLEMSVTVAREEVAAMLRRDHEGLSSALRAAGYRPEVVNIQVNPVGQSAETSFAGSRQQEFQQSSNSSAGQGQRDFHGRDREFEGRKKNGSDDDSGVSDVRRTIGGVYL